MDDHTLVTMLLLYGIPMEEGLFICEHYPRLAKQINPTLAAGLGPFDPRLRHAHHFGRSLAIRLTQAAMDGRDVPNLASVIPKAENRPASTDGLRCEIKNGLLTWSMETDTQTHQRTS